MRRSRLPLRALLLLIGVAAARPARAADNDGAYGRLEGDLDVGVGAGAAIGAGGPSLGAFANALYMQTGGIYATYADALASKQRAFERSISAGVALRPLFLGRYANDLERGPAYVDLALDSIELDVGAFWAQPQGQRLGATPGLELGAGLELPILPSASGPYLWVRGALRWRDADLASNRERMSIGDRGAFIAFGLAWRQVVLAHLIDAGDRQIR